MINGKRLQTATAGLGRRSSLLFKAHMGEPRTEAEPPHIAPTSTEFNLRNLRDLRHQPSRISLESVRGARREVVLDVDTGVDDALAILLALACEALHVRAITCVAGNVGVDQVVANTLAVLDAAGAPDIAVGRGAVEPLNGAPFVPRTAHGSDGLGNLALPTSARRATSDSAVELLRRTLGAADRPVTVLALGPLTNIAALLRADASAPSQIAQLIVVGGSPTDAAQPAGFNVTHDRTATDEVLASDVPLLFYGMDIFFQPALASDDLAALGMSPRPDARLAADLASFQSGRFDGRGVLGDAGAVAALLAPQAVVTEPLPGTAHRAVRAVDAAALVNVFRATVGGTGLDAPTSDAARPTRDVRTVARPTRSAQSLGPPQPPKG